MRKAQASRASKALLLLQFIPISGVFWSFIAGSTPGQIACALVAACVALAAAWSLHRDWSRQSQPQR